MNKVGLILICHLLVNFNASAQVHPRIYISQNQKESFIQRMNTTENVKEYIQDLESHLNPFVETHKTDPEWIVSRLQMYWNTRYERVYVNGMDFSHGEGSAPVPTVRFSGSRDWDTDYLLPEIKDVKPFMDDERGMYLQNDKKPGKPWEWVAPSETGHIIERINRKILNLAEDAAFLYWLTDQESYAIFATDIFMKYVEGMYYRDPPLTVENHRNAHLMGLQTFEVIHEGVVKPITVCYDFLYSYLKTKGKNMEMIQEVFRKWADQEIKYGVPGNNWNMMQARYITYLALVLEDNASYKDGKGQQYYIDQVLNQNSEKQKALKDVMNNFDPNTGIWPEVAHYSIMVSDDLMEIYSLIGNTLDIDFLEQHPILEKAILANFNYLFPNGFTTAYGDAKHARLRFNSLELLIAQYRKFNRSEKEDVLTGQLRKFIKDGVYKREKFTPLFPLFFYVEELNDTPPAESFAEMVTPTFYSPNVSWVVQRNGHSMENGMMVSKNASLGNHSHSNGISLELFAKGMVIAPDGAAGVSYWSRDHKEYYSRFPAHNTVVIDGISNYVPMNTYHPFTLNHLYPSMDAAPELVGDFTYSDVSFLEPSTDGNQNRVTASVRTSDKSGYFVDIFRSARKDGKDKKHEYLFHGQGVPIVLTDAQGNDISTEETDELSSANGDLVGYDYFEDKRGVVHAGNFMAQYEMPSILDTKLKVNVWMKGYEQRQIFTVNAPYSRALHQESVPEALYHKPLPTLVVRQTGEAKTRPFVAIIDAFNSTDEINVKEVTYFNSNDRNSGFVGINVLSGNGRRDFIYNHDNAAHENNFSDGSFTGSYGIASFIDGQMHSLFLGSGTVLEKNSWRIELIAGEGAVLVKVKGDDFIVDADKPFKLTMPVLKTIKNPMLIAADGKSYAGKLIKVKKQRMLEFELPALENTKLTLKL